MPKLSLPYGTLLFDKNNKIIYGFLSKDQQWRFEIDDQTRIPKKIKIAVILSEDKRFYFHPGFDPISFLRAFYINLKNKKFLQGGSTITMQTIRILEPKKRTIFAKIKEILQALKLEVLYPKEKILKLYLSIAPMGGNISGVRAGALKYFGKDIDELTWAESATLAALLKSPSKININKDLKNLKKRRDYILKLLHSYKIIDKNTLASSISEELPSKILELPKEAPHFSFFLYKNKVSGNFITTIDLNIQKIVEDVALNNYPKIKTLGINSLSIVVLDTKEGKIRGYLGSPNFYDKNDGQVDGVQALRSTGSILKPFLYALYIEKGFATEGTLLPDFPMHFGDFKPENSNQEYEGAVPLRDCLISSLNIPAVWVLHKYGYENFYNFLKRAEISTLSSDPSRYGLTLVIGGAEGKLIEITNLFRVFSNGGIWSPYTYNENKENKIFKKILSPGASYIIYNILQDLERPEKIYYPIYPERNFFAWKTGTSFKQRDAWACGTNAEYTIGVWAGNFSGKGNQNIMGASISGPILFQIFSALPMVKNLNIKKDGVKEVFVCSKSGFAPKEECEDLVSVLVPEKVKNLPICPYHKSYYVDEEKSQIVCSACWNNNINPVKKSFFILTPKMKYYSELAGKKCENLLPHNPLCKIQQTGEIKILYPEEGSIIKIPKEYDGHYQKVVLKAHSSSNKKTIHWLIDQRYIGKTIFSHNLSIELKEGKHLLHIIDEEGNSAAVQFKIIKTN